jgi:hypothetical protein
LTIVPNEDDTKFGSEVKEPGLSKVTMRHIVIKTGTHYEVTEDESVGPWLGV